jgi:intraflagellar transport protein 56
MASCFFLLRQFDDVLVYLNSVKNFFENDDDFNWNYGIALAGAGNYKEAQDAFARVQGEKAKTDDCYLKWLTRTYIMNGKARYIVHNTL